MDENAIGALVGSCNSLSSDPLVRAGGVLSLSGIQLGGLLYFETNVSSGLPLPAQVCALVLAFLREFEWVLPQDATQDELIMGSGAIEHLLKESTEKNIRKEIQQQYSYAERLAVCEANFQVRSSRQTHYAAGRGTLCITILRSCG